MRSAGCAAGGSSLYDRIISVENLFAAFYEFRKGKRHKEDVPEFEYGLEKNIFQLRRELKKFVYQPLSPKIFKVSEPKPRFIQAACVRDRIVHRALVRIINPIFDPAFIYDSYACRTRKGTLNAVKRLEDFWRKESRNYTRKIYLLKADIRKYFDSIDHVILLEIIKKRITCPKTLWLIKRILAAQPVNCRRIKVERDKGLPIGNLTSQLFANIYLHEFDEFVKHGLKMKFYIRYVDDFIIVSKDRVYLVSLLESIENFLKQSLRLDLHPVKRKIFSSRSGVDFLGYFIRPYYKVIRFGNIRRFLGKVNRYKRTGRWREKKEQSLAAWMGYAGQCDSYNLLKNIRLQLAVLCLFCFMPGCSSYNIKPHPIRGNLSSQAALNLVFCPLNYRDKEIFLEDTRALIDGLKRVKPFDEFIQRIGFYYVIPSRKEEKLIFNEEDGFPPLKVRRDFLSDISGHLKFGYKLIIIDASGWGSCAELSSPGKVSLIILGRGRYKNNNAFTKGFLHELGHSLGLRDEGLKSEAGRCPPGPPNCATSKEEAEKWWGDLTGSSRGVRYINGCCGNKDYIRPTIASLMNDSDKAEDFGPVNERFLRDGLRTL